MFALDPERAHEIGIAALTSGLVPGAGHQTYPEFGRVERFGLSFANPVGVAAGFDKNGVAVNPLASLGFGFVEVGTVTPEPQPGNPKPRMFRLPADGALINRLGFNNDGAITVAERLAELDRHCIVGVNIGRNKHVPNEGATENYLKCLELIHPVADYIAVNVSSPNTPDLRELQKPDALAALLGQLDRRNRELGRKPLLIKIAPDLDESGIESVVDIAMKNAVAGIIATNTTIARDRLKSRDVDKLGQGGLSGRPLANRSNQVISMIYRYSKGRLPIIGVGGVFDAGDAFSKIAAGASLVQVYTGFVYGGPSFAADVNAGLAAILKERGFKTLDDAVGSGQHSD